MEAQLPPPTLGEIRSCARPFLQQLSQSADGHVTKIGFVLQNGLLVPKPFGDESLQPFSKIRISGSKIAAHVPRRAWSPVGVEKNRDAIVNNKIEFAVIEAKASA
jgi:hypothetical protein